MAHVEATPAEIAPVKKSPFRRAFKTASIIALAFAGLTVLAIYSRTPREPFLGVFIGAAINYVICLLPAYVVAVIFYTIKK
jgi:hypothetical protein